MVTSKIRAIPPMTFNVVNRLGFPIPKARDATRFLHLTPTGSRKKLPFLTSFFRAVARNIDVDMADFSLR